MVTHVASEFLAFLSHHSTMATSMCMHVLHACMYVCMYICMYVCTYVCMCLVLLYAREDTCATERVHAWVSIGGVYWTDRRD